MDVDSRGGQPEMTDFIQVITTIDSQQAASELAAALVQRRLAGCVQVLGPVTSTYRWQGQVETSQEWLCLIKSQRTQYAALEQAIRELHSYEVPEILALAVEAGSAAYLEWLAGALKPTDPA
jgi:periplasmic divalent cation tolerance protein